MRILLSCVIILSLCLIGPLQAQRGQGRSAARSQTVQVTAAGQVRDTLVFPPTAGPSGSRVPLVLVFHAHGATARVASTSMHFQTSWPEALVAYPQGIPTETNIDPGGLKPGWETNDDAPTKADNKDLAFVDALLKTLHSKYSIDDSRIYATGFSNGATMTLLLWTTRASTFAAFAPVSGVLGEWKPTVPKPILYIGGEKDPLVTPAKQRATIASARGVGATVQVMNHPGAHVYPDIATEAIVTFFKNNKK